MVAERYRIIVEVAKACDKLEAILTKYLTDEQIEDLLEKSKENIDEALHFFNGER